MEQAYHEPFVPSWMIFLMRIVLRKMKMKNLEPVFVAYHDSNRFREVNVNVCFTMYFTTEVLNMQI